MKVASGVWILLLLAASISATQTSTQAPDRHGTVILEVVAEDFDIAWRQEYLYLKAL